VQIGPFTIARTKRLPLAPLSQSGSWWPIIRESFTGAWQNNVEIRAADVLTYSAVYACISLIAGDIAKLCLRLVEQDDDGIWTETSSAAFSPFLRKPNRYQTRIKFVEQWITSKLTRGNTYALKQRDNRGVVTAAYVLDPGRVTPLVTPMGDVYYEIKRDDLSEVNAETIVVPASEVFHDIMCALWHPLIGVSPIYACGTAALQGLSITNNSQKFFSAGSNPSGVLTAPGAISDATAARLKAYFEAEFGGANIGKVAVAGDGLKYEQLTMSAVDSQLIEQLKWTAETVCSCFHVPPYMIGVGPPPPYANIEPLLQQYYSQCIQSLLNAMELVLDEGLGIAEPLADGTQYGTEFDIDDLIWMDTTTRTTAAVASIGGSGMSPNEARKKYLGLGPIEGGDSAYMQQQNYSLEALAARDASDPFAKPPAPVPLQLPADTPTDGEPPADMDARKDLAVLQATVAAWEAKWADLNTLRERVAVCEVKQLPPALVATADDEDDPDLELHVGLLLQKELAQLPPVLPLRRQQQIFRDEAGRIDRVVDTQIP
jgi:HK97 family phage portal protein